MARTRKPPKGEHVEIVACEWLDAMYIRNADDNLAPIPLATFGYVWKDTPDYYAIAFELHADGTPKHLITVPKAQMWPKLHHIGYFPIPKSFFAYLAEEDKYL